MQLARAQLEELKAEVEFERRLRRKAESLSRALARELSEERAEGGQVSVCEEVAYALVKERQEMERVMEKVEEERRMMRVRPRNDAAGPSSSSSLSSSTSVCERGKRSLACTELQYKKAQLRMLQQLRDKKDYMF